MVVENGSYEITGNQAVPGAGRADLAAMASAAGFPMAWQVDDVAAWEQRVDLVVSAPGPVFVSALVSAGDQGPLRRVASEEARYLRSSLADWSRVVRGALGVDEEEV